MKAFYIEFNKVWEKLDYGAKGYNGKLKQKPAEIYHAEKICFEYQKLIHFEGELVKEIESYH